MKLEKNSHCSYGTVAKSIPEMDIVSKYQPMKN